MSTLLQKILRNFSTRILLIIFLLVLIIVVFFIANSYFSQLRIYREKELTKLKSIAFTLSLEIDGNAHRELFAKYKEKDAISSNDQVESYYSIYKILKAVRDINELNTTLYTMVYDPDSELFLFGVSTSDQPFFRHTYKDYPDVLIENYDTGGTIPPYEDEHGTWLSAFAPIKDKQGNTVAIIQVDEQFDVFIGMVHRSFLNNALVSLILIGVITFILIRIVRRILRTEEDVANQMIRYNKIIEQKNKNITSSIQYAKKIQEAIFVPYGNLSAFFPDSCIYFKPRDIVSGDFYWNAEVDGKILVAAVDCTGHGVPGAFMSLIGNILLKDIILVQKITRPDLILNELNEQVKKALKPTDEQESTNDGMDMALVSVDVSDRTLEFSGAKRPLLYFTNDVLCEIKGDRMPIGGKEVYGKDKVFTNHSLQLNEKDLVVLFSDGLIDQFGGEKNRKFLISQFKEFLEEHKNMPLNQSMENLDKVYLEWKGDYDQVDDILVIGFRL